jgi:acetoacetate decarboxylase
MSFVKTPEELSNLIKKSYDFYEAEFLLVYWETNPDIIKKMLPPPLKPAKYPVVNAFIAEYPKTNFGINYKEGALFIFAEYGGITGIYCLAMPVDNDMALIGGREVFGYPKKIANVNFKRSDKEAEGWIERHGIKFFEVKAKFTNKPNAKDAMKIILELGLNPSKPSSITYNFKFFRDPQYTEFDYNPRLIREQITMQAINLKLGEAEVKLAPSKYDPWSELSVKRMLGCIYLKTNTQMQPGEIVAETDSKMFQPFSFMKVDPY